MTSASNLEHALSMESIAVSSNAPLGKYIRRKGVTKELKGGFHGATDKNDDPCDFQFEGKGNGGKTSNVADEEGFDMVFAYYLLIGFQRVRRDS